MARYFFDVGTPDLITDEEGTELPDLMSVLGEAEACAEDFARGGELTEQDRQRWVIQVRDESGLPIFELPLRDWLVTGASLH